MTYKAAKAIALFQIAGGVVGVLMGLWPFLKIGSAEGGVSVLVGYYAICLFFSALYAFSLWAGLELWKGKRIGYTASMWVQALQIPLISSQYLVYNFVSGISLAAIVGVFGPSIKFLLGNSFSLGFDRPGAPFAVGINCLAILILIFLYTHFRKVHK